MAQHVLLRSLGRGKAFLYVLQAFKYVYLQLESACVSLDGWTCGITTVWFLSSMDSHMFLEIASLCKLFVVHVTSI